VRVVFAGTPEFAERALVALLDAGHDVALILTRPDRPAGRGMHATPSPVKRLGLARRIEVYQPATLKPRTPGERIAAAAPELLVVAAYGLILPQRVLELAPFGAINIHASLLPRWRGAAPIQRAIMAGDTETGITIMQMDQGLDTGPMLAQQSVAIEAHDDAGTLHDKLAVLGAQMIVRTLDALARGQSAAAMPQPEAGVSYAHKLDKQDMHLDWRRPAHVLACLVRALRPVPGALTLLAGEPLKVWEAQAVDGCGEPGRVIGLGEGGIVIACGVGALAIRRLQRAGGKRLDAAAFLRGRLISIGDALGMPSP